MENEINEVTAPTIPESKPASGIVRVFYEPKSFFAGLRNKKAWIIPLVVIIIIGGVLGQLTKPILVRDIFAGVEQRMEQARQAIGEERYNQIMDQLQSRKAEAMSNEITLRTVLTFIIVPLVIMFVIAGVGKLVGNFMLGGKAGFWLVLNVIVFTGLIGLAGDVIKSIMILAKDTSYVYLGLGLLKPVNDGSFLFYLFRQIELFSIWRLIATCIGLGAVYNISGKKFGYALVPIWVVFVLLVAVANIFTGGSIVY